MCIRDREGEEASIELMTVAFTRMAEEVQVLIDTRTKEMKSLEMKHWKQMNKEASSLQI